MAFLYKVSPQEFEEGFGPSVLVNVGNEKTVWKRSRNKWNPFEKIKTIPEIGCLDFKVTWDRNHSNSYYITERMYYYLDKEKQTDKFESIRAKLYVTRIQQRNCEDFLLQFIIEKLNDQPNQLEAKIYSRNSSLSQDSPLKSSNSQIQPTNSDENSVKEIYPLSEDNLQTFKNFKLERFSSTSSLSNPNDLIPNTRRSSFQGQQSLGLIKPVPHKALFLQQPFNPISTDSYFRQPFYSSNDVNNYSNPLTLQEKLLQKQALQKQILQAQLYEQALSQQIKLHQSFLEQETTNQYQPYQPNPHVRPQHQRNSFNVYPNPYFGSQEPYGNRTPEKSRSMDPSLNAQWRREFNDKKNH